MSCPTELLLSLPTPPHAPAALPELGQSSRELRCVTTDSRAPGRLDLPCTPVSPCQPFLHWRFAFLSRVCSPVPTLRICGGHPTAQGTFTSDLRHCRTLTPSLCLKIPHNMVKWNRKFSFPYRPSCLDSPQRPVHAWCERPKAAAPTGEPGRRVLEAPWCGRGVVRPSLRGPASAHGCSRAPRLLFALISDQPLLSTREVLSWAVRGPGRARWAWSPPLWLSCTLLVPLFTSPSPWGGVPTPVALWLHDSARMAADTHVPFQIVTHPVLRNQPAPPCPGLPGALLHAATPGALNSLIPLKCALLSPCAGGLVALCHLFTCLFMFAACLLCLVCVACLLSRECKPLEIGVLALFCSFPKIPGARVGAG